MTLSASPLIHTLKFELFALSSMLDLSQHTDVHVLFPTTTEADLIEADKTIPSDTHLVRYIRNEFVTDGDDEGERKDVEYISALRAYKMSDIFDALHDNGCTVLEIRPGFGTIKPKLYGFQQSGQ